MIAFFTWSAAISAVMSLYASALMSLQTGVYATGQGASTGFAVALVVSLCALAALSPRQDSRSTRRAPAVLLLIAMIGFAVSSLTGLMNNYSTIQDWAVFFLLCGVPALLWRIASLDKLLAAVGVVCIAFAMVDAVANLLAQAHLVNLVSSGRFTRSGLITRYPGLSGNTHAAGMVCFLAISCLAWSIQGGRAWRLLVLATIALLFYSLTIIDARRYLMGAVIMAGIPLVPFARRLLSNSLVLVMTPSAFLLSMATAEAHDVGNAQRAQLMGFGLQRAMDHIWIGGGAFHRAYALRVPDARTLIAEGVTESGVLDLSIQCGVVFAAVFIACSVWAACAKRDVRRGEALLLAVLTAEFTVAYVLESFLGSLVFFAALIYCLRDKPVAYEARVAARYRPPVGAAGMVRAT